MPPALSCTNSWISLHQCGVSPSDHLWIMFLSVSKVALIQVPFCYLRLMIQLLSKHTMEMWKWCGLHSSPCSLATGLQNLQLSSAFGQSNCYSMELGVFSFFVSLFQRKKEDGEKSNLITNPLPLTVREKSSTYSQLEWNQSLSVSSHFHGKIFLIHWPSILVM